MRWIRAICKVRGLDPMTENIRTIKDAVSADKTLATFEEFINGHNNP